VKFERFEEIIAWQKAKEMTTQIYTLFKDNKDYGFKDQIQRASVSVMNNIAEGYERKSNTEFRQFLYIAKGSCGEVRSMIQLAKDLCYISEYDFNVLNTQAIEISKTISGLIKTL
jgi:four helix bundle protein